MKVMCCSYERTYGRLRQVLKKSVRRHCPTATWDGRSMMPAAIEAGVPGHATINTGKLWTWNEAVQAAEEDIICVDADMVCLADLAPAFDGEFDFAYTVRPGLRRYQGGAVYVRNTDAAKAFMQEWTELNEALLDDPPALDVLIKAHGGINQAALHLLVETECGTNDAKLAALPCEIWNSCAQTWGTFGPQTRLLHMTGRLRRAILEGRVPDPEGPYGDMIEMVKAWLTEAR